MDNNDITDIFEENADAIGGYSVLLPDGFNKSANQIELILLNDVQSKLCNIVSNKSGKNIKPQLEELINDIDSKIKELSDDK